MSKPATTRPTSPVTIDQVTPWLLAKARGDAERSWLPQTVWASHYVGADYVGSDCLLVNAATAGGMTPEGAVGEPLLTVLPAAYLNRRPRKEAHPMAYAHAPETDGAVYGCRQCPDLPHMTIGAAQRHTDTAHPETVRVERRYGYNGFGEAGLHVGGRDVYVSGRRMRLNPDGWCAKLGCYLVKNPSGRWDRA